MTKPVCYRCGTWDGVECSCDDRQTLFLGDSREIIPSFSEDLLFDLVLTDPPYSSGGAMRSDRNLAAADKYRMTNVDKVDPDFTGDNRDQRAFTLWCSDWMGAALWRSKPGACILCFIDWRNLPCVVDAIQVGGWVFRAIVPWNKTEATRPNKGWFRAQCEYIVGGSAGALSQGKDCPDGKASAGFFEIGSDGETVAGAVRTRVVGKEKRHLTEKPVRLIESLLVTRADWRTVFDPFAGSGTTLRACKNLGRRGIGIEASREYCDVVAKRLAEKNLFDGRD